MLFFCPAIARSRSDRTGLRRIQDLLRKTDPRTIEATWRGIGEPLGHFTPAECANYLVNAGYASA